MVRNPKHSVFEEIIARIRERDQALREGVVQDVTGLIPAPVDVLAARGTGWSGMLSGMAPAAQPPPAPSPNVHLLVRDGNGAAVPNAQIVITSPSGAFEHQANAGEAGDLALQLEPGTHEVTATTPTLLGILTVTVPGPASFTIVMFPYTPGGGGGGPREIPQPELAQPPPGSTPEPGPAPLPSPAPTARFPVGSRVLAFLVHAGTVAAVPAAPGGLYSVDLDSGIQVMAAEGDLRTLSVIGPGPVAPPTA